jgi:flagellar biosynthesis GTPase FlhF
MSEMTLAEKIAADAKARHGPVLAEIVRERTKSHKKLLDQSRAAMKLIRHFRTCCHAWIQRNELSTDPESEHMVRELRKVLEMIEQTLNEVA